MGDLVFGVAPPGFRLPPSTRIGRVTLRVADLERSLAFYRDVTGFRLIRRSQPGKDVWAELGAHGSDDVWLALREQRGLRPVPRRGLIGLYHFALLLPDRPSLGRFLRHITAAGVVPGAADHIVSEALYLTDPDGIVMEVYRDRPRDEWRVSRRELVMASDPLDREGLIAAGGAEPWAGVPAGSRVGHMHFYVEDLRAAEAFYHAALGFDKIVWSFPGALFLAAGGYHHHVGTNTWAAGAPIASPADAGLDAWELVLPDPSAVQDAMRSLEGGGFQARAIDDGIAVADPWGITARITAR
jgi:catechol 2,3-dioxygenase